MRQRKGKDKFSVSKGRKGSATDPWYTHLVFRDAEAEAELPAPMVNEPWEEAAVVSVVMDEEL